MNKYKRLVVVSQGRFSSMFSRLASVNFRKVLEPTLEQALGHSVIFQHEVLKTLTKNDPGSELRNVCTCSQIFWRIMTIFCIKYKMFVVVFTYSVQVLMGH